MLNLASPKESLRFWDCARLCKSYVNYVLSVRANTGLQTLNSSGANSDIMLSPSTDIQAQTEFRQWWILLQVSSS